MILSGREGTSSPPKKHVKLSHAQWISNCFVAIQAKETKDQVMLTIPNSPPPPEPCQRRGPWALQACTRGARQARVRGLPRRLRAR